MNFISLIGLSPYVILAPMYKSHGMLLIALNGILFHCNPKNKFFYCLDFSTNSLLFILTTIQNIEVLKYSIFCFVAFLINVKYIKQYNCLYSEYFHVIFVQWVGLYAITQFHKTYPCSSLLFYC